MVIKLSGAFCIYYLLLKYGPLPFGIAFGTGLIRNFGAGDFLYGPLPPPTEGDPLYGALLLMFLLSSASYADNQSSESWFFRV